MLFDIDLPEWANWIAQDANGEWWAYSYEPATATVTWGIDTTDERNMHNSLCKCTPPEDFTLELYEVTWK